MRELIAKEFEQSRRTYGTRRLKHTLARQGYVVSQRRIGRLLSELGLCCKTKLVNDALLMAIRHHKPKEGLVYHTDQGKQYTSESHRSILELFGITQSMSRKGNCCDNAVSESFFHTLKTELIYHCKFKTREEARQAIFEYIEVFYNQVRAHSANDYVSPAEFEITHNFG